MMVSMPNNELLLFLFLLTKVLISSGLFHGMMLNYGNLFSSTVKRVTLYGTWHQCLRMCQGRAQKLLLHVTKGIKDFVVLLNDVVVCCDCYLLYCFNKFTYNTTEHGCGIAAVR